MRLQQRSIKNLSTLKQQKPSKVFRLAILCITLFSLLSACTPYNGQVYTNNGNLANRPYNTQNTSFDSSLNNSSGPSYTTTNTITNNTNTYYPDSTSSSNNAVVAYYPTATDNSVTNNSVTNTSNSTGQTQYTQNQNYNSQSYSSSPPSHGFNVDQGVNALLSCTAELGYNSAFTTNDYQNCLQMTQASLTDFAFDILGQYILSWADFAVDTALGALGITTGRSYASPQQKSSQLTSVISSGYRWYD